MNNRSNNDHSETISACEIFRQLREQYQGMKKDSGVDTNDHTTTDSSNEHSTLSKDREPLIIAWMACKQDKVVSSISHDGIFYYRNRDDHKPCLHPNHHHRHPSRG